MKKAQAISDILRGARVLSAVYEAAKRLIEAGSMYGPEWEEFKRAMDAAQEVFEP